MQESILYYGIKISTLADQILTAKQEDSSADTTELENEKMSWFIAWFDV